MSMNVTQKPNYTPYVLGAAAAASTAAGAAYGYNSNPHIGADGHLTDEFRRNS